MKIKNQYCALLLLMNLASGLSLAQEAPSILPDSFDQVTSDSLQEDESKTFKFNMFYVN